MERGAKNRERQSGEPAGVALDVRDLRASYRDGGMLVPVLAGVSVSVAPGEFVAVVGPSGSGKSTLLNAIAGLIEPDAGEIAIAGRTRTAEERLGRTAYMHQRDLLMPWRTVVQNAALALEASGIARRSARAAARARLDEFGLAGFGDVYPAQLSGGMRQRVAFLRTVLAGRPLLLLDEPFGALDALTRAGMQVWLAERLAAEAHSGQVGHARRRRGDRVGPPGRGFWPASRPDRPHRAGGSAQAGPRGVVTEPRFTVHKAAVLGSARVDVMNPVGRWGPAAVVLAFVLLGWELAVRIDDTPAWSPPPPSSIARALDHDRGLLAHHAWITSQEVLIGTLAALVAGVLIAVAIDASTLVERAVYPIVIGSQAVPIVAPALLLLVWFGYGLMPKVIVVALIALFPIVVTVVDGLRSAVRLRSARLDPLDGWRAHRAVPVGEGAVGLARPVFRPPDRCLGGGDRGGVRRVCRGKGRTRLPDEHFEWATPHRARLRLYRHFGGHGNLPLRFSWSAWNDFACPGSGTFWTAERSHWVLHAEGAWRTNVASKVYCAKQASP